MGPRPFSRGNSCELIPLRALATHRFNGATAFQPWKLSAVGRVLNPMPMLQWGHGLSAVEMRGHGNRHERESMLQWGHGLSAVEILDRYPRSPAVGEASMGPRPFSRGNGLNLLCPIVANNASMGPRPFSRGNERLP